MEMRFSLCTETRAHHAGFSLRASQNAWVDIVKVKISVIVFLFLLAIRHSHFSRSNVLFRMRLLLTPENEARMKDESERERNKKSRVRLLGVWKSNQALYAKQENYKIIAQSNSWQLF
jgi:hypothetical protein